MIQVHHCEADSLPFPDDHFDCLVAAKGMGRRAVGVDNDPGCIPVAEARVKAVNKGLF